MKRQDEKVVRLAKPVRKGLLRLIFSRFLIIFLLLLLQVGIGVVVYQWLNVVIPYFASFQMVLTAVIIIYLFNSRMDPSSKLTWMWIIAISPIFGGAFLLFARANLGFRNLIRQVREQLQETKGILPQDPKILEKLETESTGVAELNHYLNRSGCFPVYSDTSVTYFPSGEAKFEALLEELQKAEKFIFLEYFIIEEGYMWGRVLKILLEKVKAGVEVRVLYDGMCEMFQLRPGYFKLLEKEGIQAKTFLPIKPLLSSHYNYRDHRKILVIDGKVAFTGGVNLADEYINRVQRFGHWKDTAIMLKGPAVRSFTLMFLQMWNLNVNEALYIPYLHENRENSDDSSKEEGYVMPYGDSPLDEEKVGESVYIDMLYRANDYVHIMTPYLILDGEMEAALLYAAERGIDVKLILPGIPDKKIAYALAKSHYRRLVEAGVEIYEYTPGFVHAKTMVSDHQKAIVGTINLDYRSLYHHFECAAYLYQVPCIAEIDRDFEETLGKCRRVTEETIRHEKLFYRVMGQIMKFVAPLF